MISTTVSAQIIWRVPEAPAGMAEETVATTLRPALRRGVPRRLWELAGEGEFSTPPEQVPRVVTEGLPDTVSKVVSFR